MPTAPFSTLLIDLDDTLFEERDYVRSGFAAVAAKLPFLAPGVEWGKEDSVVAEMMATLDREGRGRVFDSLFDTRGIAPQPELIRDLVKLYRQHQPEISLYDGTEDTLAALAIRYRLALVTNGDVSMQRSKVAALNIEKFFHAIIYCDEQVAPKPDPAGLHAALKVLDEHSGRAVMIGDNPHTDGLAASAVGIPFLRVRTRRFYDIPSETPEVASFSMVTGKLTAGFSI